MATTITTGNATNGGASISSDNTGILELKTGTGAGTTALTVDTSQNVGIGTSSPVYRLDVLQAGATTISSAFAMARITGGNATANDLTLIGPNTSQVRINFGDTDAGNIGEVGYNHANNSMRFVTNGSAQATIDSSGNVGIGTTNPSVRLHIVGASQLVRLQNDNAYIQFANTANTDTAYIQQTASIFNIVSQLNVPIVFGTNATERARITAAGGFTCAGIYNTTVGATNRDVFVDNTGVVGYVASIREAKTNIQDLTDTSWLHQLNPVTFHYRKKDEEGNYTDETDGDIQYGMIAEDVEQVRPDLCFYDEVDGEQELRGIQYSKLVPAMLKEIQKLRAEIEALKGAA